MPVFELSDDGFSRISETSFDVERIGERRDLQRLLRDQPEVIVPDVMVLAEEFGYWDDSRRRIDLLGLDKQANLVVVELKRGGDGFMDLQALRYAAMVSTMTFEQASSAHAAYLESRGRDTDATEVMLSFLGWDEPSEDDFGQDVRVVLVAPDFSKELTTAVLWLNDRDLDIRCVRVKPYSWRDTVFVDVQQVIPLPEATEYQVKVREKVRRERQDRESGRDFTKFDVTVAGETFERLPKRRAMYLVVRSLCDAGVSPAAIQDVLSWRGSRLWRDVDGEVDTDEFVARARAVADSGGPAFELRRWFLDDDELIVYDGRTYALSSMWGTDTEQGMRELLERFSDAEIEVTQAPGE